MTVRVLRYSLDVFNFEKEKARRFLIKNKNKSEEEIIRILNCLEYGNY